MPLICAGPAGRAAGLLLQTGRDVLDLIAPARCVACSARAPSSVCADCLPCLRPDPQRRDPTPRPPGLPPVYTGAVYDGAVRAVIVADKERGVGGLAGPLRLLLDAALAAAVPAPADVVLVPVPSSRRARRARGRDHVRELARDVARGRSGARVATALRHTRRVQDQAGLDAGARARNLRHAYTVRRPAVVAGRRVVVVDDIVTTGATAAEATRALVAVGADVVAVVAVASPLRRGPLLSSARVQGASVMTWRPSGSIVSPDAAPRPRG